MAVTVVTIAGIGFKATEPAAAITEEKVYTPPDNGKSISREGPTITPSPTMTPTPTMEPLPTFTPTPIPTFIPTRKPTPKPTSAPTPSPRPSPKPTAIPTRVPTKIPTPTATPTSPSPQPVATQQQVNAYIDSYAGQYGVDANVLRYIGRCESGLRPNAVNKIYGGIYQFSASTWSAWRNRMGEDPNPDLRFNGEEAVQTAAYVLSKGQGKIWPNCMP